MRPTYNYKLTVVPAPAKRGKPEFNSRNTKPLTYTAFVYKVRNKDAALRVFKACRLPALRRNGLRAPTKASVKIERISLNGHVHA